MKHVVTISRRTDIVGCYWPWLRERIAQGGAEVPNPFTGQPYYVDLRPQAVHSLVLMSKNFGPLLAEAEILLPYRLYFEFTINGYGPTLEPSVPHLSEQLEQARQIISKYGQEAFLWRFDPIIFTPEDKFPGQGPREKRLNAFEYIGSFLSALGVRRVMVSFVQAGGVYPRVARRLKEVGCYEPDGEEKKSFLTDLVSLASALGMEVRTCAQSPEVLAAGVREGACVDGAYLEELFGGRVSRAKQPGMRRYCRCTRAKDLGSYRMVCRHGCIYCYASPHV